MNLLELQRGATKCWQAVAFCGYMLVTITGFPGHHLIYLIILVLETTKELTILPNLNYGIRSKAASVYIEHVVENGHHVGVELLFYVMFDF